MSMSLAKVTLKYFAAAALTLSLGIAQAQTTTPSTVESESWQVLGISPEQDVLVVTSAKPTVRQKCRVQAISAAGLTCAHHPGSRMFPKQDIVALLLPAVHRERFVWPAFFIPLSAGGAIVYAAAVIASVSTPLIFVAVPVAIVGGFLALASAFAFYDDTVPRPEALLYLQPGSQLAFALRT
jgi:hypothetical protein